MTGLTTIFNQEAAGSQVFTRTLADSVSVTDVPSKESFALSRALLDQLIVIDLLSQRAVRNRLVSDSVDVIDVLRDQVVRNRLLRDNVDALDSLIRQIIVPGVGEVFVRTLLDTCAIIDSLSQQLSLARVLSDDVELTDTLSKLMQLSRSLTDQVDVIDLLTRFIVLTRLLPDSVSLTDVVLKSLIAAGARVDFALIALNQEGETLFTQAVIDVDAVRRLPDISAEQVLIKTDVTEDDVMSVAEQDIIFNVERA